MEHSIKKAYGAEAIARMCLVTRHTVARWIKAGKLPSFQTGGGRQRVLAVDLLHFLREHNISIPQELSGLNRLAALVVDDDPAVRKFVSRLILQSYPDASVHEAADGFEAGKKITESVPRLVVLDLRLPGMDGLRVCRLIREDAKLSGTLILTISGDNPEVSGREALAAGADDFLAKPFSAEQLSRKLEDLLAKPRVGR